MPRLQASSGVDTTFASSVSATFTSPLTAGSTILIAWEGDSATTTNKANTPTDTAGNTYTRVQSIVNSGSFDLEIWVASNTHTTASNVITVTDTLGGADGTLVIEEWSGIVGVSPVDNSGGTTGNSTALSSGNVITANANDVLWFAGAGANGANDMSLGSSWSNLTQTSTTFSNIGVESKIVTTAGTYNGAMTASTSASWAGAMVALKVPPSVIQRKSAQDAGSGTITATMTSAVTLGNAIICILGINNNTTNMGAPTDGTNTYVLAANLYQTSMNVGFKVYIAYNAAATTPTVTANDNFNFASIFLYEVSGLAASSAYDTSATQQVTGTSALSPSITTNNGNELLLGIFGTEDTSSFTYTVGSGYSNVQTQALADWDSAAEEQVISTQGAYTASAGGPSGQISQCAIIAFSASVISAAAAPASYREPLHIPNKFVGPMAMRHNFRQVVRQNASAGYVPQQYTQSVSGGLSFTGAQSKATNKSVSGGLSFVGSVNKQINKGLTAGASFTGVFAKSILKLLPSASITLVGAFSKMLARPLNATLSFSGSYAKSITKGLSGTLSFTGAINRQSNKSLAAGLTFSGLLKRQIVKTLTGAISFTGSFVKVALKALAGSLSFNGIAGFNYVQGASSYTNISTSAGVAFSSNNTVGNMIVVSGYNYSTGVTLTVSDTQGNTYYSTANSPVTEGTDLTACIWYAPNIKAGANTVTVSNGVVGTLGVTVMEYAGLATSSPVDVYASNSGNGTSFSTGTTPATAQNNELIIVNFNDPAGNVHGPSGYTQRAGTFYELTTNTVGTQSATGFTGSGTSDWTGQIIAFKPASVSDFSKQVNKNVSAGLTFAGSIKRQVAKAFSGSLSYAGAMARTIFKTLPLAALTTTGSFVTTTLHHVTLTAASIGFAGSFSKQTAKTLTGGSSFSGAQSRTTSKVLTGALTYSGAFSKRLSKNITAVISYSGSMARSIFKTLPAGALSFSGSLTKTAFKTLVSGALSFSGAMTRSTAKSFTAGLSFSGVFIKGALHYMTLTASLSFVGNMQRVIYKSLTGGVTFSGSVTRSIAKTLTGGLSYTGSLTRSIIKTLVAGGLAFAGSIIHGAAHFLSLTAASLSFTGSQSKQTNKSLASTISFYRTNLIPNPSFETGLTGWNQYGGSPAGTLNQSSLYAYSGTYSAVIVNSSALSGGGYAGGLEYQTNLLIIGVTYTVSAWIYATVANTNISWYIGQSTNPGNNSNVPSGWSQVSLTFVATQNNPGIYLRSNTYNVTWYADAIQLETGSTPSTYFDGSFQNASWTGTANASSSVMSSSLTKQDNRSLTAGLSFAGGFTKTILKGLSAAGISFAGALAKRINKTLTGSVNFTGSFSKSIFKNLAASLTFTGAMSRRIVKTLTGAISFTGNFAKAIIKTLTAASLSFAGSFSKRIAKALIASVSFAGSMNRQIGKLLAAAALSLTGSFKRGISKTVSGSLSYSGSFAKSTYKLFVGTLTYTGSHVKRINKSFVATMNYSGSFARTAAHYLVFSGALSYSGKLARTTSRVFTGSFGFVGNLMRNAFTRLFLTNPLEMNTQDTTVFLDNNSTTAEMDIQDTTVYLDGNDSTIEMDTEDPTKYL